MEFIMKILNTGTRNSIFLLILVIFGNIILISYIAIHSPAPRNDFVNPVAPVIDPVQIQLKEFKTLLDQTKKDLEIKQQELKDKQDAIDAKVEKLRRQQAARTAFADNLKCLADNIYYEAGFEPEEGRLAVAQVTMNRLKDPNYPKTVCGVVYERHRTKQNKIAAAFSWTLTPFRPKGRKSKKTYDDALELARNVLTNQQKSSIIDEDVKYYHASYIRAPNWASDHEVVAEIGHHIFYR